MRLSESVETFLIENEDTNETLASDVMSELNGDWIRAARAKRAGDLRKLERMDANHTVTLENDD